MKGAGNSVNYKYRMHDPRIGRFFAVDPLTKEYPWNSPYAFSENRVTDAVELEGLESKVVGKVYVYNVWVENGKKQKKLSHTDVQEGVNSNTRIYRYFDSNGNIEKEVSENFGKGFLEINRQELINGGRTRKIGGEDYEGVVQNATQLDYDNNVATAFIKDLTADIWNAVYQPTIDGVSTIADPNTSVVQKAEATVTVITSMPGGRGANKLTPNKLADGPHSTFKRGNSGQIYKYETYDKTRTGHFNPVKRYDGGKPDGSPGAPHNGVPTPHINEKVEGRNVAREPTPEEIPRSN